MSFRPSGVTVNANDPEEAEMMARAIRSVFGSSTRVVSRDGQPIVDSSVLEALGQYLTMTIHKYTQRLLP